MGLPRISRHSAQLLSLSIDFINCSFAGLSPRIMELCINEDVFFSCAKSAESLHQLLCAEFLNLVTIETKSQKIVESTHGIICTQKFKLHGILKIPNFANVGGVFLLKTRIELNKNLRISMFMIE